MEHLELDHGLLGMSWKHDGVNQGPLGTIGVSVAWEAGWHVYCIGSCLACLLHGKLASVSAAWEAGVFMGA